MEETILNLIDEVNLCGDNQTRIIELINSWTITDANDDNDIIEIVMENIDKVDLNLLPYMLQGLYEQNNILKFQLFCMILEEKYEEIPFLTPLENIPLFEAKYEALLPTIIEVTKAENGIADCMYLILLNHDPKGDLLLDDQREELIENIKCELEDIISICENNEIDKSVYNSLEIVLDVATYINNDDILELVNEFQNYELNGDSKLFLIKALACNNMYIKDNIIDSVLNNEYLCRIVEILEREERLEVLKDKFITQLMIATSDMYNWLRYPTELGEDIGEVEFVDILKNGNDSYYIFKFTASGGELASKGYMVGISGGYKEGGLTASNTGYTFSMFEKFDENYIKSAEKIIEFISESWCNRNK